MQKKKGFQRSAAGVKLAVELALADDSPESVSILLPLVLE